jgi:amino acid permease
MCAQTKTDSYSDAWDATVGTKWSPLIALSCLVDCFAGNLSYSMILADTFMSLLAGVGVEVTRTQSLLGVTGVVLLPLCLLKNLSSLAPFSLVGIVGMLYTTLAMVLRYFSGSYQAGGEFFGAVSAPVFGDLGASSIFSPNSVILLCMLSNAFISHFM